MYTYEYYSAVKKKNEIVLFVTTWMDFMLSEINRTEKKIAWSNLYVERKKQKQTHRYKQVVARDKENCVQKVQTFSYKINKSWNVNVQHGDYS